VTNTPYFPSTLSLLVFARLGFSSPLVRYNLSSGFPNPALQIVPLSLLFPIKPSCSLISFGRFPLTHVRPCILPTSIISSNSLFDRCIYRDLADTLTRTASLLSSLVVETYLAPAFLCRFIFGWCYCCHCLLCRSLCNTFR
jgi:hypothetical protein